MGRLAGYDYRQVTRRLKRLGFGFLRHGAGSHEIWTDAAEVRKILIANHPGDMPEGTLRAILRQAGVEPDDFLAD